MVIVKFWVTCRFRTGRFIIIGWGKTMFWWSSVCKLYRGLGPIDDSDLSSYTMKHGVESRCSGHNPPQNSSDFTERTEVHWHLRRKWEWCCYYHRCYLFIIPCIPFQFFKAQRHYQQGEACVVSQEHKIVFCSEQEQNVLNVCTSFVFYTCHAINTFSCITRGSSHAFKCSLKQRRRN